jgi:hypothetical protein
MLSTRIRHIDPRVIRMLYLRCVLERDPYNLLDAVNRHLQDFVHIAIKPSTKEFMGRFRNRIVFQDEFFDKKNMLCINMLALYNLLHDRSTYDSFIVKYANEMLMYKDKEYGYKELNPEPYTDTVVYDLIAAFDWMHSMNKTVDKEKHNKIELCKYAILKYLQVHIKRLLGQESETDELGKVKQKTVKMDVKDIEEDLALKDKLAREKYADDFIKQAAEEMASKEKIQAPVKAPAYAPLESPVKETEDISKLNTDSLLSLRMQLLHEEYELSRKVAVIRNEYAKVSEELDKRVAGHKDMLAKIKELQQTFPQPSVR